jgi:hypothetical protein
MTDITPSAAGIGDDITVSGHVIVWDGLSSWIPYTDSVFLVVTNGGTTTEYTGETADCDSSGDFDLTFTVNEDFVGTNYIQANTSTGGYDTNCSNFMTLYIRAAAEIVVTDFEPFLTSTSNYQIQGVVREDTTQDPYSGAPFDMEFWYGDYGTGSYGSNISVSGIDGTFSAIVTHDPNYDYYTLYFPGNLALLGGSVQEDFDVVSGIDVTMNNIGRVVYQNSNITITGTIRRDTGTFTLANSEVNIVISGSGLNRVLFNGTLGTGGTFNGGIWTVENITGTFTITVTVTSFYSNGGYETVPAGVLVYTQEVRIRAPTVFTNIPWEFIVIGVGAAGAIVGIFFLQRWLMKRRLQKDKEMLAREIEERLENVRKLYRMGRVKEALAYLYVIYTDLALFKYGIEKEASQTTTEFAIVMVKQYGSNPQNIYPFIQEIEQVIYGGYPYNEQVFMRTVGLFDQIYQEIMQKPLPPFQLN